MGVLRQCWAKKKKNDQWCGVTPWGCENPSNFTNQNKKETYGNFFWDTKVKRGYFFIDFMQRNNNKWFCLQWNYEETEKAYSEEECYSLALVFFFMTMLFFFHRGYSNVQTQKNLDTFGWEVVDHQPYNLDLAPNDFNFFHNMKTWLSS